MIPGNAVRSSHEELTKKEIADALPMFRHADVFLAGIGGEVTAYVQQDC